MTTCTVAERSLSERVKPRIAVEREFARLGHTYRHGPLHFVFEHYFIRPVLESSLRILGLYNRGLRNALTPVIREIVLNFSDLPPAFHGFRLLQISDLHIDGVDGLAEALGPVIATLRPDACVLTGDYRFENFGPCDEVYPRMRQVIEAISAEHGVYGILGNHDAAEIAFRLEDLGVRMLVNEGIELKRNTEAIWLLGIDDPFDFACDDIPAALAGVPPEAFKILLAHAPERYEQAVAHGIQLYLTGHTHAGQIRLPIIGAVKHNARCPNAFRSGLWNHAGMHGYTSAGVGCSSLPVRFNCPPELVMFELRRA